MSRLLIKHLADSELTIENLPDILSKNDIEFQTLENVNWSEYPYKPDVKFRIAHNYSNILLEYKVTEKSIKAIYGNDNGDVWTDSCVEFFVKFEGDDFYYNLEFNCIGTALIGTGKSNQNRERLGSEVLSKIQRHSSLGREIFEEIKGEKPWMLNLIIPKDVFVKTKLEAFSGVKATANFYKCGDDLETPHFISWSPIDNTTPNFHLPQFFKEIAFQ